MLPLVREAAQALADPQLPGANRHGEVTLRAVRLAGLLQGEITGVAGRAAAIYASSIWMGETWDTDRKLRGANDPMGEPLSDPMRRALSELIAVLPAFARQFPSVMQIEDEREAFFAEAENMTAVTATIEGAREAELIDAQNEAPVQEALAAGAGAGTMAAKGQKTAARSTRNLVLSSVVSAALGFASGEVIGGAGDAFGIDLRKATAAFLQKDWAEIETIFSSAPADQQHALKQLAEKMLSGVRAPPAKAARKVHVVGETPGKGDFTTIQAAIEAAEPGDRIVVREGTYRESLRLSKELEIIGQGDRERILVTAALYTLHCNALLARIAGLRFRREAEGGGASIWITGGGAVIDDCVVESHSWACMEIEGSASTPTLQRCLLRGLFLHSGAHPVLEDCRFSAYAGSGLEAQGQFTRATLRRCVAENNTRGFHFHSGATGVLDECEAIGNGFSGVTIAEAATSLLRNCILRDNRYSGLFVTKNGRARVEGGRITGNALSGILVEERGAIEVAGCTISGNAEKAIMIADAASTGTFHNNDLRGNGKGAWRITEGAKIIRAGNTE